MLLDAIVAELDAYFRVPDVRDDDWSAVFETVYPEPYWRDHAEPVDHAVGKFRRDDLGAQAVSENLLTERLARLPVFAGAVGHCKQQLAMPARRA